LFSIDGLGFFIRLGFRAAIDLARESKSRHHNSSSHTRRRHQHNEQQRSPAARHRRRRRAESAAPRERRWERAWQLNELRAQTSDPKGWSLAADKGLQLYLQQFAAAALDRTKQCEQQLDEYAKYLFLYCFILIFFFNFFFF
jgi:hypothetical protein